MTVKDLRVFKIKERSSKYLLLCNSNYFHFELAFLLNLLLYGDSCVVPENSAPLSSA